MASAQSAYDIAISVDASNPQTPNHYNPPVFPIAFDQYVHVGDTVTWHNNDQTFHTVTSGDPSTGPNFTFDSGILSPGQTYSFKFAYPDDFKYYCTVHPFMKGLVKVRS